MENQINYSEQIISQVLGFWSNRNKAYTDFFNKYPDRDYLSEVAPGRNRAIYLLGHLIASNDAMIPLFGLGEKLFPELEMFSGSPDKSFEISSTLPELKKQWETLTAKLSEHFNKMTVTEWMDKHTSVSAEDFVKEPQRNKLNVLISRTNHQSYHLGQLNLLSVKELA